MKAFDCAQSAQSYFSSAGNMEGAQIAQQASNKIYLSMEEAMRSIRVKDVEEFGQGGRMRNTYTFAVYGRDEFGSVDPQSRQIVKQRAGDSTNARTIVKQKYPGMFVERMGEGGMVEEYGSGGKMSEADYYGEDWEVEEFDDDEFGEGGNVGAIEQGEFDFND